MAGSPTKSVRRKRVGKRHVIPTTTIKISRRSRRKIETSAKPFESVNDTLRRLFRLSSKNEGEETNPLTTTIKVDMEVMKHVKRAARPKESRDMTIERLLGIAGDDGNVEPAETPAPSEKKV